MEGNGTGGKSRSARRAWPLFVGLPLIILAAVGAVLFAGGGEGGSSGGAEQAQGGGPSGGGGQTSALGHPALGREDAPVVMIEYGDYG